MKTRRVVSSEVERRAVQKGRGSEEQKGETTQFIEPTTTVL